MCQLVTVLVKGIINVDHLAAGITENDVNALIDQSADQDIGTGKFHVFITSAMVS